MLNSIFDPYGVPATGIQSLYYDQLKAIYNRTVVKAATMAVSFIESADAKTYEYVMKIHTADDTSVPTTGTAMNHVNEMYFVFHGGSAQASAVDRVNIKRYINMSKWFATDVTDESRFDEADAGIAVNTSQLMFTIWGRHLDGTNLGTATTNIRVDLKQWVLFKEKKELAMS